jgi:hypothetical protein
MSIPTKKRQLISLLILTLLILSSLILPGCAGWSLAPARPADEVAGGRGDRDTTVGLTAPAEAPATTHSEGKIVTELEAGKEVAVPASESVLLDKAEVAGDAYRAGGSAGSAVAPAPPAAPLPLPTASPSMAEAGAALSVDVAPEREAGAPAVAQQAQPLKAGEVDDNRQWDDYLLYRRNYYGPQVHDRDVTERYIIEVKDGQGHPVLGAQVRFFLPGQERREIYSAYTYANGQVLFHPLTLRELSLEQTDRFIVEVQYENLLEQFSLTRFDAQPSTAFTERWTVSLDLNQQLESLNLDVLFLVDATGSMADEINQIQSTIFDVAAQIDALPERPDVRYGLVTYRDRGDSFVTQSYEFTPDVRDFSKNLNTVFADGGGDYPESLNEGLHHALHNVEWRGAGAVQLIFLIADAPPHLDYVQDYDYAVEMENAASRGIKIFPIASSGLDDQGEYIFRQLAQYTQGRFVFLTYAGPTNGGAPGETTTHHVDDYSVENLDDLLVRLVEEELAFQNPQFVQAR